MSNGKIYRHVPNHETVSNVIVGYRCNLNKAPINLIESFLLYGVFDLLMFSVLLCIDFSLLFLAIFPINLTLR